VDPFGVVPRPSVEEEEVGRVLPEVVEAHLWLGWVGCGWLWWV
jgi:hypothetical protein